MKLYTVEPKLQKFGKIAAEQFDLKEPTRGVGLACLIS